MIINIAGTSGSGKSTLVRWLMAPEHGWASQHEMFHGEKQHIGYLLTRPGRPDLFVCGRYDNWDTGGCDTIKNVEFWYDLIACQQSYGRNVLFEGLFVMNHTRGLALARQFPGQVTVIRLTTPVSVCKESINERRARRGDPPKTEGWKNTEGNDVRARNFADKLKAIGATVHRVDREGAKIVLRDLLLGGSNV